MSWISIVSSIINAAFPSDAGRAVTPPPGLEGARVGYINEGRSGRVCFTHGVKGFEMYFEFGGGDTVATIDVPEASSWEQRTGLPLALRRATLEFIGATVVRDQTTRGTGRFEIHDRFISIHA